MPLLNFTDPDLVISSQKYWFRGITLAGVGYGMNLTLFVLCVNLLRCRAFSRRGSVNETDRTRHRWDIFSLCYTTLMFCFATISIVLEAIIEERAFVRSWVVPAGPSFYLFDSVFGHITTLRPVYVAFISCHFLAAGLLTWRCLILYRAPLGNFFVCGFIPTWVVVMTLPISLLFISIGTGMIFVVEVIAPGKLAPPLSGPPWAIIWGSVTVALSWTLTSLIVVRLLAYRSITRKALGKLQHVRYTSLVVMFVESAGLLSLISLFFIVVFSLRSPTLVMAPFLLTQVQALSSLLAMYQITDGKAWARDVIQTLPMPSFASAVSSPIRGPDEYERELCEEGEGEIKLQTRSIIDGATI